MKNAFRKFALLGVGAVMLSGVVANTHAQEMSFEDPPQVKTALAEIEKHVKFMEDFGIMKGIDYTLSFDVQRKDGPEGVSMANVFGQKYCDVSVGVNLDGTSGTMTSAEYKAQLDPVLNYSMAESLLLSKAFAGHEISHCRLIKMKDIFQVADGQEANTAINKVFGNTMTRSMSMGENGKVKADFGLGDFLNESYADGMAFATLVKAEGATPENLKAFEKISINRHLQTLKISEDGVMQPNQVDAYDLRGVVKELSKKENIDKILAAQTPEDLDKIVLESANKAVWMSLAKKDPAHIEQALGKDMLLKQAQNYLVIPTVHLKDGSIISRSINHAKSQLSSDELQRYESAVNIYGSSGNVPQIKEATKTFESLRDKMTASMKTYIDSQENEINQAVGFIKEAVKPYRMDKKETFASAIQEYAPTLNIKTDFLDKVRESKFAQNNKIEKAQPLGAKPR